MFNSFKGTITEKGGDYCCLETGGVEWLFLTSLSTLTQLKVGRQTKLYSYLQHKEDGMTLFGFASSEERALFLNLIKVNGVGPKAAAKILSGLSVADFQLALNSEDIAALTRIPGLGKATAQKIVLALKGRLVMPGSEESTLHEPDDELTASLTAMGFDRKKAAAAVKNVRKRHGGALSEAQFIKEAIIELSK
jgi:Holliday junction DNA helicase RuvA